jgi:hypothetical protein
MHVDEFIDDHKTDNYASWFFALHRYPAMLQMKFGEYIAKYQLYCDYKESRYRVVGCSRMGDVWLTKDFTSTQYQERVDVADCSAWSPKP